VGNIHGKNPVRRNNKNNTKITEMPSYVSIPFQLILWIDDSNVILDEVCTVLLVYLP